MKKTAFAILTLVTLSACNTNSYSLAEDKIEPHMIAGSEARKYYCKRRNTHTQKDYFDCVKGYGGQHSQYSRGVVYPDKNTEGDK